MYYLSLIFKNKKSAVGICIFLFFTVIAIFAPYIAPYSPTYMGFAPLQASNWKHLLGTTVTGQDVFSQIIWGTRVSLEVGILVGFMTTIISTVIGLISGYFGSTIDEVLTAITNVFLIIPGLPLMIILAAYLPSRGMWTIIFVITITGWAWGSRVLRPQVMSLKKREFVSASIVVGERSSHIVFYDIFPNIIGLIVANFFGSAVYGVLSEAGLEFIGLGNVNAISWGTILYWAQNDQAMFSGLWGWLLVPGLLIALLGMSFALMNFAVDEITNPRLRKR
uniref:ABC transporter permease n=1 Tax=Thermodesulfobium narugense TaxID=184064 RepID=A0A7C5PEG9_9BACT